MSNWKRLDMRRKDLRPEVGALTALRMTPNNGRATFYRSERYDIGYLEADDGGRKLWWHSTCGTSDFKRWKQHYDIWWCPVAEFDGI